jgi:hypothetical protein
VYLILSSIIILSFFAIGYILFKKNKSLIKKGGQRLVYPKTDSDKGKDSPSGKKGLGRKLSRLTRLFEEFMTSFVEKFFRRASVRLMKFENKITRITSNLRQRSLKKKLKAVDIVSNLATEEGDSNAGYPKAADSNKLKTEKSTSVKKTRSSAHNSPIVLEDLKEQDEKFDEDYWINLLKHDSTNAYPYKKLGEIYAAREDFKEARAVLKYALKLDKGDDESKVLLESLKGKRTKPVARGMSNAPGRRKAQSA